MRTLPVARRDERLIFNGKQTAMKQSRGRQKNQGEMQSKKKRKPRLQPKPNVIAFSFGGSQQDDTFKFKSFKS
jgi:hypothetical protein